MTNWSIETSNNLSILQACCCQEETKNFIQCAFNDVYITKYGVLEPCSQSCGGAEDTAGGSSLTLIIVVVATLFLTIGFCTFMYYRKRPSGPLGKNEKTPPVQKHDRQGDALTASFSTDKVRYDIRCQCRGSWFVSLSSSFDIFFRT